MLPPKRSDVGKQIISNVIAFCPELIDGAAQIDGIPEGDGCHHPANAAFTAPACHQAAGGFFFVASSRPDR